MKNVVVMDLIPCGIRNILLTDLNFEIHLAGKVTDAKRLFFNEICASMGFNFSRIWHADRLSSRSTKMRIFTECSKCWTPVEVHKRKGKAEIHYDGECPHCMIGIQVWIHDLKTKGGKC